MKLVICTPFYEMKAWTPYMRSLIMSIIYIAKQTNIEVDFWQRDGDAYVYRARNYFANKFMNSDFTDMMFIDSDMSWDLPDIGRILQADVDIVGAGYPCKNTWKFYGVLFGDNKNIQKDDETGLMECIGAPTGFMKIKKEVFLKLKDAYPDDWIYDNTEKVYNFFGHKTLDRVILGEDISFCRRWTKLGGKIYIDPRIRLGHWGVNCWSGSIGETIKKKGTDTKLNLGCGTHALDGFINLDKSTGWSFEDGLNFENDSVDAITISHAIMYVPDNNWRFVFNEFERVLKKGGILRITEDATDDPVSDRFNGYNEAVSLTSFSKIENYIKANFIVYKMKEDTTKYKDKSLLQSWHGGEPKAFFLEAIK